MISSEFDFGAPFLRVKGSESWRQEVAIFRQQISSHLRSSVDQTCVIQSWKTASRNLGF